MADNLEPLGPLGRLPIACTLTPTAGAAQVERWHDFGAEFALDSERTDTRLIVHYATTDDSIARLRALVDAESACCAFVRWEIDDSHHDLRLIVSGTPDQLAALNIG